MAPGSVFDLDQAVTCSFPDNGAECGRNHCPQPITVLRPPLPTEDFLAHVPLFRELPRTDIQRIAGKTVVIDAPRGTVLLRRGDPCRGFHVIVYGRIKLVLQSPQGGEKVVALMGPGQSFGEALMFIEEPYLVTAETIDDAKLLHVSREIVFAEIDRDPGFALRMLAGLSWRLHHLLIDVESYTLHSGTQRVIGYLLRDSSENSGINDESNTMTITLPAAKGVIASRLNLTQEHFSRILHQLMEAGLIVICKREIRIPDVERLRTHESA
jgi:CRP-like cAMP-binding protein